MMKNLMAFFLCCHILNLFAEEVGTNQKYAKPIIPLGLLQENSTTGDKESFQNKEVLEESLKKVQSTLNISDEEFSSIMAQVDPEIFTSLAKVIKSVKPNDQRKIESILKKNKMALLQTYLTGEIPKELDIELSKSIKGYRDLNELQKKAIFKQGGKVATKLIFENLIKSDAVIGYLLGSETSTPVAEINWKLLNLRSITIGDYKIENVHMEVQAGYPKSGLVLLSGKIRQKNSSFSYEGQILSLSSDQVKDVVDFSVANARLNYEILPWLEAYGGLNLGVRSYEDGLVLALDPRIGVEVNESFDQLKVNGFTELGIRIAEGNMFYNCGGSIGLNIIDNDHVIMDAALMNRLSLESDPRIKGNSVETFNGIVIKGRF